MFAPRASDLLNQVNAVFSLEWNAHCVFEPFPNWIKLIQLGHFPKKSLWCNARIPQSAETSSVFQGKCGKVLVSAMKTSEGCAVPQLWAECQSQWMKYCQFIQCQTEPDVLLNSSQAGAENNTNKPKIEQSPCSVFHLRTPSVLQRYRCTTFTFLPL